MVAQDYEGFAHTSSDMPPCSVCDGRGSLKAAACRVYWGSHGCQLERGHDGPHECDCCTCDDHPDPGSGCVASPPYYGPGTTFYGEDV